MCRFIVFAFALMLIVRGLAAEESPDPTRPGKWMPKREVAGVPSTLPVLTSVLIGEHRKLAVIDGALVAEGEQRQGLKVWRIEDDHVVVSVAGRSRVVLSLDNNSMSKEQQ